MTVFRIAGPAGHEIVYWLVSPSRLNDQAPRKQAPPERKSAPTLIPDLRGARSPRLIKLRNLTFLISSGALA